MKHLIDYFFESDLEDLKDKIVDKVQDSTNIKVLKKVNKLFELTAEEYEVVKTNIKDYFNNRCGWNTKISENIRQKIKNYGATKLFGKLFDELKDDSSKNEHFLTGEKIIKGSNLYKLIYEYTESVVKNDEKLKNDFDKDAFDKLLEDIGSFTLGGKVATGAMEFLSAMFLKDLNPKNAKGEGKVVCDINTKNYGFEYKASGARIAGNKEESKPLSPEIIDKTFIKLISNEFSNSHDTDTEKNKNQASSTIRTNALLDKDLDNALKDKDAVDFIDKLSKRNNLFRNGNPKKNGIQLSSVLEPLIELGINENKLNNIVLDSFLSQVPNLECDDTSKKYLIDKYPIIEKGKANNNNLRHVFLVLGLCNYWSAEKWDYMILFDNPKNGNYYVIPAPKQGNLIKSMDENITDKAYSDANPAYGSGTNAQNHAPMIKYKK